MLHARLIAAVFFLSLSGYSQPAAPVKPSKDGKNDQPLAPEAKPPAPPVRVKALEKVAVLHEGRLKPMETFARHVLLQYSGRTAFKQLTALEVVSQILFTPEKVRDYPILLINNPEVAEALGVKAEKRRRYSFRQLEPAFAKLEELAEKAKAVPDAKQDLVQKEILRVHGNLIHFVNLSGTLSMLLPNEAYAVRLPETKTHLQLRMDKPAHSFWELLNNAPRIAEVLQNLGKRKEQDERTPMENEILSISQAMYFHTQSVKPSPFKFLPLSQQTAHATGWVSPSEVVADAELLRSFQPELDSWAKAGDAYLHGRQDEFDARINAFTASIEDKAYGKLKGTHFPLEILYQHAEPFYRALALYWIALLLCFAFFLLRRPWLYHAALWLFLAGYALHVAGIISRIIIMKRPPVTSLYETFPFVAAVSILAALFLERIHRRRQSAGIGLVSASLLGVILLSIANRYAAEGDTLKMLVAVLNSNFWLSTHVICVTIGYSACLLAGAIGHIYLVRALMPATPAKADRLKEIAKMVYGVLCFGLLFSFIGTVLGGIWADQSWGRFWGWDPKENGAMLIVLWCIILLHAKQWNYIKNQGLALGAVFGAIVVSLAWFGVNLLNVGLHSYGFTDGAANKLFTYIGVELLFMGGSALALKLGMGSLAKSSKSEPDIRPVETAAA